MHIVVITKAVQLQDGTEQLVQTPFESLSDWAKELVRAAQDDDAQWLRQIATCDPIVLTRGEWPRLERIAARLQETGK